MLVLARWTAETFKQSWVTASEGLKEAGVVEDEKRKGESAKDADEKEVSNEDEDLLDSLSESSHTTEQSADPHKRPTLSMVYRHSLFYVTETLATLSEACDLAAFLTGTGLAWQWRQYQAQKGSGPSVVAAISRRREGLERWSVW